MNNVVDLRPQVLSLIRAKGPVLPVQISSEIKKDTFYVGAIFSELIANKQLRITHAKIGGSPLYYVEGQEAKLDKLYDYLPGKEKEAYTLLKKERLLKDSDQQPAIRVALRNLKDFAKPFENEGEILWKWYLTNEQEVQGLLTKFVKPKEIVEQKIEEVKPVISKKIKPAKTSVDNFLEQIKDYLLKKNVKILNENVIRKNSEIEMIVRFPSNFGDLEYFLKAKNKQKISEGDLSLAHHKGQKYKTPTLFLSSGSLTKKAKKYINDNLRGYLIFRELERA